MTFTGRHQSFLIGSARQPAEDFEGWLKLATIRFKKKDLVTVSNEKKGRFPATSANALCRLVLLKCSANNENELLFSFLN